MPMVDLMEMREEELYFDAPLSKDAESLIQQAADNYADSGSEQLLLKAYDMEPEHLSVHVALYRYYYYKHQLEEALVIADKTIACSGSKLGFMQHWQAATLKDLQPADGNMAMVRYYLLALKGSGFICLRLGRHNEGVARLRKVVEMDGKDRLGAGAILEVIHNYREISE